MVKISKSLLANEKLERLMEILLVLFGVYIVIQILRKIFGASWSIEDIIIGLLILNLVFTFTIAMTLFQLKSDHAHLKGSIPEFSF